MNERIQELLVEAHRQTKGGIYNGHLSEWSERFAELIVRECLDIAQDRAAFDGFPPNDVNHIIDEIKLHFGVEE